jgi:hypothetical protein
MLTSIVARVGSCSPQDDGPRGNHTDCGRLAQRRAVLGVSVVGGFLFVTAANARQHARALRSISIISTAFRRAASGESGRCCGGDWLMIGFAAAKPTMADLRGAIECGKS